MAEQYLSIQEKQEILDMVTNIYGEETVKNLNFNVLKNELQSLLGSMQISEKMITKSSGTTISEIRYYMNKEIEKRNLLAAKGYMFIFKLREYLFNEVLQYRYYFFDNEGNLQLREFSEEKLLDLIDFSQSRILLNSSRVIKEKENASKILFKNKMSQYLSICIREDNMKLINAKNNLRQVRKTIMQKYGKQNPGLRKKSNKRQYQNFNMGHIVESLDITMSSLMLDNLIENSQEMKDRMFGQFLKRDNVIASKGGDNFYDNTSIKSGTASIYSYDTIVHQLKQIELMLNDLSNPVLIKEKIKYLFIDSSGKNQLFSDLEHGVQKSVDIVLEEAANRLINSVKK